MNSSKSDFFLNWDLAQVARFIDTISPEGEKHGESFERHNIDGSLLPLLKNEHLKELGIWKLSSRLRIKKGISEIIGDEVQKSLANTDDIENILRAIGDGSNKVNLESLILASTLIKDILLKLNDTYQSNKSAGTTSPTSPMYQMDMRRLNDNFNKLKAELIPVVRMVKESKPLPTPSLDPSASELNNRNSTAETSKESLHNLNPGNHPGLGRSNSTITEQDYLPTQRGHRLTTASIISTGIAKKLPMLLDAKTNQQDLREYDTSQKSQIHRLSKPRLFESKSSFSLGNSRKTSSGTTPLSQGSHTATSTLSSTSPNEPLKQLRASSDDSCLKILQQAMKCHRIPRDDWLKYVLVICYKDKERILKLNERPVLVFKDLQESGKHPAIMLRQLDTSERNDDHIYEDSRIGDDIPGGSL